MRSAAAAQASAGGVGSVSALAEQAAPSTHGVCYESEDEAPLWHDARDFFDGAESLKEAYALATAPAAAHALVSPTLLSLPLPVQPLDDDDWLPPGATTPRTRAAALSAMRAGVLATPDAADVALWEDRSPATLERFLRARDYDVAVASELFLEHRAWRKSLGWRVTGDRVPPSQFEERKIALQARSRAGAPLLIIIASRHNKEARDMTDIRNYIVYTMDKIMDAMRPGEQFLVLLTFKGLSRRNIDVKALLACFDILQKFYVERVQHIWFVEPPAIFWAMWKMVTPFVAPKTREKIVFLYGAEVNETLLRHFDAAEVPTEFGGTGTLRPLTAGPAPWEAAGAPRQRRY